MVYHTAFLDHSDSKVKYFLSIAEFDFIDFNFFFFFFFFFFGHSDSCISGFTIFLMSINNSQS